MLYNNISSLLKNSKCLLPIQTLCDLSSMLNLWITSSCLALYTGLCSSLFTNLLCNLPTRFLSVAGLTCSIPKVCCDGTGQILSLLSAIPAVGGIFSVLSTVFGAVGCLCFGISSGCLGFLTSELGCLTWCPDLTIGTITDIINAVITFLAEKGCGFIAPSSCTWLGTVSQCMGLYAGEGEISLGSIVGEDSVFSSLSPLKLMCGLPFTTAGCLSFSICTPLSKIVSTFPVNCLSYLPTKFFSLMSGACSVPKYCWDGIAALLAFPLGCIPPLIGLIIPEVQAFTSLCGLVTSLPGCIFWFWFKCPSHCFGWLETLALSPSTCGNMMCGVGNISPGLINKWSGFTSASMHDIFTPLLDFGEGSASSSFGPIKSVCLLPLCLLSTVAGLLLLVYNSFLTCIPSTCLVTLPSDVPSILLNALATVCSIPGYGIGGLKGIVSVCGCVCGLIPYIGVGCMICCNETNACLGLIDYCCFTTPSFWFGCASTLCHSPATCTSMVIGTCNILPAMFMRYCNLLSIPMGEVCGMATSFLSRTPCGVLNKILPCLSLIC